MIALKNNQLPEEFVVIHPMFDEPEQKRTGEGLGKMPLSRSVRFSLIVLRGYLVLMSLMLVYHLIVQVTSRS